MSVLAKIADKTVAIFSPARAAKRKRYRKMLDSVSATAYDATGKGPQLRNWLSQRGSANRLNQWTFEEIRDRARDLVRNNPYAARIVSFYASQIIGDGVRPHFKEHREFDELVDRFCKNPDVGADGNQTLLSQQSLAEKERTTAGSVFIVREWLSRREWKNSTLELPFQTRLLESEFLDTRKDGQTADGNYIIRGIEVDDRSRPVAYHFYKHHPDGVHLQTLESERILARDVIHLHDQKRPGEVISVSELTPVMTALKNFKQMMDTELIRQKVAASFMAFVHSADSDADFQQEYGKLSPARIQKLAPGEDVTLASPPDRFNLEQLIRVYLRQIATGVDMTYEQLAADFSQVNFTSGRMGNIEWERKKERIREHVWRAIYCTKMSRWLIDASAFAGFLDDVGKASWSFPARRMIDPEKEIKAKQKAVRNGISTLRREVEKEGLDFEQTMQEAADDFETIDDLGLIFDADPRKTTQNGQHQQMVTREEQ